MQRKKIVMKAMTIAVLLLICVGACLLEAGRTPSAVALTVNGREIPRWMYANAFNDRLRTMGADADRKALRKEILTNLIDMELLLAEAERLGYTVNEAGGRLRSAIIEGSFGDADVFDDALQKAGMNRDQYAELWRQQTMVNLLVDHEIKAHVTVTDGEVAELFAEERARFGDLAPASVEPQLRQALLEAKAHSALDEYLAGLRQEAKIRIYVK